MTRIGAAAGLSLGAAVLSGCVVATGSSRSGGSGVALLVFFLPLLFFVLMARSFRRIASGPRRPPAGRAAQPVVSARMLRAELSVLADDVLRLEPQVAVKEEARSDFEAAVHRYRVAQAALDHADAPVDLSRVQRVVDEATWSMARAKAIVEGRSRSRS